MIFIGICGASGSGKTTLAEELAKSIGVSSLIINQDSYYISHNEMSFEERVHLNYDEPQIFDHELLYNDIKTLLSGKPINKKRYDYSIHLRNDSDELIYPKDVLILEGIHAFYDQRINDLMFMKLYINVEPDICLLRRIKRDIKERERGIDSIGEQYLATVKPMYDKYIRNYVNHADVIVTRGGKNAKIVEILGAYLKNALK